MIESESESESELPVPTMTTNPNSSPEPTDIRDDTVSNIPLHTNKSDNNNDTACDYDDSKHNRSINPIHRRSSLINIDIVYEDYPSPTFNVNDIDDRSLPPPNQKNIHDNFFLFSLFFSLNHGGVVSCLSLATARLGGSLGSYQSCALYGSHTLFSLLGAAGAVRRLGGAGKNALVLAMWIYCAYVGCFAVASVMADNDNDNDNDSKFVSDDGGSKGRRALVILGGVLGGIGGGFLWTAQGTYFARVSAEYAAASGVDVYGRHTTTLEDASKRLGGSFAAVYMLGELVMRLFSSIAITTFQWEWTTVFLGYTCISLASALLTSTVVRYYDNEKVSNSVPDRDLLREATSMVRLLRTDRKMKYFVPFCVVFALASSFLVSFINGEVLPLVLGDADSVYVGPFGSFTTVVAAVSSVLFARLARYTGNRPVMALGCTAFVLTSLLFILLPDITDWGWGGLLVVYGLQGIGRATFEGNLRAEFAVMFARDKEGAFANIVFWKGLFGALGFFLTANLNCSEVGRYCIEYKDGSLHVVLVYELMVLVFAVLALVGLSRVHKISRFEQLRANRLSLSMGMKSALSIT